MRFRAADSETFCVSIGRKSLRFLLHLALSRLKRQVFPQLCVFFQSLPNAVGTLLWISAIFAGRTSTAVYWLTVEAGQKPCPSQAGGRWCSQGKPLLCVVRTSALQVAGCRTITTGAHLLPVCHLLSASKNHLQLSQSELPMVGGSLITLKHLRTLWAGILRVYLSSGRTTNCLKHF